MRIPSPALLSQILFCVSIGLFTVLTGCQPSSKPINVVAIDRSGSTQAMREKQIDWLDGAIRASSERDEIFTIWVVDRQTSCIFPEQIIPMGTPLSADILTKIKGAKGERAQKTRPALFWEEMAKTYSKSDKPVRIAFLTDGGNDWAGEEARVKKAVETLAANPLVNVALVGIHQDLYADLNRAFSPFGSRLVIRNSEMGGLEEWRRKENR